MEVSGWHHTPAALLIGTAGPSTPIRSRKVDPHSRSGSCEGEKNSLYLPGNETLSLDRFARIVDPVPNELLSQLPVINTYLL
jgi:hypothetical protein